MKLWLLKRYSNVRWDEYDAFVVRAPSVEEARLIASRAHADEGDRPWLTTATCVELTADGDAGVVLGSFNAG